MFLKSLEVFGFKSFADRTRIEFTDGITALLGPNGCGKSNVVDAVKWVLGEQAAKTMRAEKMEDVIFNGTETRKPLNVAEVSLTIANEAGLLPLDVSEINIKRRLYRSGESEYYINNTQVKLKDVRELFWDTGVGKTAYSVMEQGKIDQILSSKPEERRYLFEEAAGITRFKARRAEAERKLQRTEENIKQAEGILNEVKRSYDSLKIQSEKTTQYRKLREDIFNFELDIQLLKLKGFIQDKDRSKTQVVDLEKKREIIQKEIDEINASVTENMDEVKTMEEKFIALQKEVHGIAIEQNGKKEQLRLLAERQNEAREKVRQLEGRKRTLEDRVESLAEECDEKESDLRDLTKRLDEIAKNISDFENNITLASNQINQNNDQATNYESNIHALNNEMNALQQQLTSITEDIVKELDKSLKEAGYSTGARNMAEEKMLNLLGQIKVVVSGRKAIFSDFATISNPDSSSLKKFADNGLNTFSEMEILLNELENAVNLFIKNTPSFIDEFLSPEGIITKKRNIDSKIENNKTNVEKNREKISLLKDDNAQLLIKINEYKAILEKMRLNQMQMKTQVQSAEEQLRLLRRELISQETQLHELENEIFSATKSFDEINDLVIDIEGEIASLEHKGRQMTKEIDFLEADIKKCNSAVAGKQESITKKGAELGKIQSQIEKIHLDLNSSEIEIRNIKENFRETHSRDLMEYEERMYTILTPSAELRDKRTNANQKLKDLGSVNLMAPEEFSETKERYDFLAKQLADLNKAREDLNRITEEIRAESTELFLVTYNKIKKNFHNMFRRLFGGGRAELRLTKPENVLESGVDIFAQPPGKKLENIALLSGGEKTMTAIALLFATYMVRPSPFCLLDEIDAALDEHNVNRFIMTLREFANVSQYIVITHNKKTVAGATTMLGVTMEEFGVSKIITIKLDRDSGTVILPEPEPFEEEDVEPELGIVIPAHPPKRKRGPSGEIIDEQIIEEDVNVENTMQNENTEISELNEIEFKTENITNEGQDSIVDSEFKNLD
ncbi:MAG: AAA family ATPase [Treponema sp.]|nr:AAA family ATPase [Treponema sp.]